MRVSTSRASPRRKDPQQGDPTVAIGTELDVIAAVVIGGGSLSGGEGSILGSMVGALVLAFLRNGSQQMGWPTYVQEILIGASIVAAGAGEVRHCDSARIAPTAGPATSHHRQPAERAPGEEVTFRADHVDGVDKRVEPAV